MILKYIIKNIDFEYINSLYDFIVSNLKRFIKYSK